VYVRMCVIVTEESGLATWDLWRGVV
jgi:hypothetical protein